MSLATTGRANKEQDDSHRNCRCDAQRMAIDIEIEHTADPKAMLSPRGQPINNNQHIINQSSKLDATDHDEKVDTNEDNEAEPDVQLSDFIGDHGFYQLALSILLFVRYVLLGLMANSGPLMTPDVIFYCQLPMQEILYIMPNISKLSAYEQELEIKEEFKQVCQIDLHLYQNQSQLMSNASNLLPGQSFKTSSISTHASNGSNSSGGSGSGSRHQATDFPNYHETPVNRIRECTEFSYQLAPDQGRTLTSEFNLVCDDDWLRSLFQSLLSASIVLAHVIWGTFSDKYGRFQAQRLCLIISLLAGTLSIFAWDFWTFTLLRAVCSFGDLGMVVSMTTTMVELVGSNYRGLSVALVNFGYALGVSLLPYLVGYCQDFRLVVGFTVLCHMVTMPFVLANNESIRWLLTNRRHEAARRELKRIMRWNHNCSLVWPSIRRQVICCSSGSLKGKDKKNENRRKTSSSKGQSGWGSSALLHNRQDFKLKFDTFVRQLERQNLCDPSSNCPVHSELMQTPRPTTEMIRRYHQTLRPLRSASVPQSSPPPAAAPPPPLSRFEPLLRPEPAPVPSGETQPERKHMELDETSLGPEVKPRLLDMVDPEHIELIRAVESLTQQQVTERRMSMSSDIASPVMDRSISNATAAGSDGGEFFLPDEHYEAYIRQRQQQCQPDCINLFAHQLSFVGRVSRLFRDKKLMIATFTIVWTTFNSELLYTSFIIINLYAGEDVNLNYVIGGCAEAVAAVVASLLLSYSPRRLSLIAFWLLISFSCFGLSLAHIDNIWAVWLLALAKFSQSCLSSIASVAAYECFPTFLRQSGSGLVFTLGMMGSVFAPLIFAEFDDHAGMDRVLIIFSISSLTAALLIYKFLKETRDCELM